MASGCESAIEVAFLVFMVITKFITRQTILDCADTTKRRHVTLSYLHLDAMHVS